MATSRATIRINFQRARQQATALEQIAEELSRLANHEFAETIQQVSSNWRGENATRYLAKGSNLKGDMTETAGELRAVAAEIRRIARRIYNAEMAALEIAQNRTY